MTVANHWQKEFERKRQALDRTLLAEVERQIAAEERSATRTAIPLERTAPTDSNTMLNRISRAFGRPIA